MMDTAFGPIIEYDATLAVEAPTNGAYGRYSVDHTAQGAVFDFYGNVTSAELSGIGAYGEMDITIDRSNAVVWRMDWSGGETDVLAILQPFGTLIAVYFFPLGGASTSQIDTDLEFAYFIQGYNTGGLVTSGTFGPDQDILLEDVAGIQVEALPKPAGLRVDGSSGYDWLDGDSGDDRLIGYDGDDVLSGGDGADTLNGGGGADTIQGGLSADDERDLVYAGAGDDWADGGYGNDLIYGMGGDDTLTGGFGADELHGQDGADVLNGAALSDLVSGGAGDDFVNGGFGHDRINGGAGADRFFHLGLADHGSDWIQDFSDADGDLLVFGGGAVAPDSFQVNFTHAASPEGERAGDDTLEEAFVIYRPTGQILWALVDGAGQDQIGLMIDGEVFDLLA